MAFTDEMLCELKKSLVPGRSIPSWLRSNGSIASGPVKDLLDRLEAAEAFIWDHKDPNLHDKLLLAWLKSSGKSEEVK